MYNYNEKSVFDIGTILTKNINLTKDDLDSVFLNSRKHIQIQIMMVFDKDNHFWSGVSYVFTRYQYRL